MIDTFLCKLCCGLASGKPRTIRVLPRAECCGPFERFASWERWQTVSQAPFLSSSTGKGVRMQRLHNDQPVSL